MHVSVVKNAGFFTRFVAANAQQQERLFDTISGLHKSTYELDCGVSFDPPLTGTGAYLFDGDVVTFVDGTELVTHLAPLNVSVN